MSLSQKQKKLLDCCPVLKEFKDFLENNVDDSHNDEDEGNDDNDEPVIGEDIIVYFTGKTIVVWGTSWSSNMGKTMEEIRKVAKGAKVVEGVIFNKDHRKTSDYQKFVSSL